MKVTGFTFIRNAVIYDYPVVEAISSILPLCDDFVVAVGNSQDETADLIASIDKDKIKIINTVWDDSLREGGKVLAVETNKAFHAIGEESDWAFYIQGDEVIHEKYLDEIHKGMMKWKDNDKVDGLLFDYLHFYGSYDYVGAASSWYRNEIRVIKNNKNIYSYRDAQGFRKGNNEKLNVKPVKAYVYHYGWVKEPKAMQRKQETFHKYWHDDQWIDKHVVKSEEFDYSGIEALENFTGTHPKVMEKRIKEKNWKFDFDISFNRLPFKDKVKRFLAKYFGIKLGYKNYKLV
ncbi:MAG TPA: glycosyltransferase family 2 protein [Cytophagaceae bacterium]